MKDEKELFDELQNELKDELDSVKEELDSKTSVEDVEASDIKAGLSLKSNEEPKEERKEEMHPTQRANDKKKEASYAKAEAFDMQDPYVMSASRSAEPTKEEKKEFKKKLAWKAVGSVVFFVLFMIYLAVNAKFLFGGEPQDVMDAIEKDEFVKDEHVTIDVDAVLSNYAYTKHRINGIIPAGTDEHFIVWLPNNAAVSVKVKNKKLIKKMNEICNQTQDFLNGYTDNLPMHVKIQGCVSTIDYEIEGYYETALAFMGFTDSGFPIYYVEIDTTITKPKVIAILAFFFVLDVICVVTFLDGMKKRKEYK